MIDGLQSQIVFWLELSRGGDCNKKLELDVEIELKGIKKKSVSDPSN